MNDWQVVGVVTLPGPAHTAVAGRRHTAALHRVWRHCPAAWRHDDATTSQSLWRRAANRRPWSRGHVTAGATPRRPWGHWVRTGRRWRLWCGRWLMLAQRGIVVAVECAMCHRLALSDTWISALSCWTPPSNVINMATNYTATTTHI